jgi:thiamine pyrophosphokinase
MGDLDSLRPDVSDFYRVSGTRIEPVADQDTNDFEKCLVEVQALAESVPGGSSETTVVALGAFGGRFDQEMAALHLLYKHTAKFKRFLLLGEGNLCFLLAPGTTNCLYPDTRFEGPTCGLLPVGGPCEVSTKGLKWDMLKKKLGFGHFVSSSNRIVCDRVEVLTDEPLVWMTEFDLQRWLSTLQN